MKVGDLVRFKPSNAFPCFDGLGVVVGMIDSKKLGYDGLKERADILWSNGEQERSWLEYVEVVNESR